MLQDEQDAGNEETYFRIKDLLSWQNILSNRQIAADIEEKWANQGEVTQTQTHIHSHTHSGASRLTDPYKYIFTPPVMCS